MDFRNFGRDYVEVAIWICSLMAYGQEASCAAAPSVAILLEGLQEDSSPDPQS